MSITTKLHAAMTVALLLAAIFFAREWLAAHDAFLRAESQSRSGQTAIAQLTKQQSDLATQLKQTQSVQQAQLAALHKDYSQAQSPEQVAALVTRAMHLPDPITISKSNNLESRELSFRAQRGTSTDPSAIAQVPLPDAPQIKAFVEQCQECQIRLATAAREADIASQQTAALKQQLTLTEKDRDTWKRAAQGGSWPRRALRRAANLAVDAGLTTLALCASHHCR